MPGNFPPSWAKADLNLGTTKVMMKMMVAVLCNEPGGVRPEGRDSLLRVGSQELGER